MPRTLTYRGDLCRCNDPVAMAQVRRHRFKVSYAVRLAQYRDFILLRCNVDLLLHLKRLDRIYDMRVVLLFLLDQRDAQSTHVSNSALSHVCHNFGCLGLNSTLLSRTGLVQPQCLKTRPVWNSFNTPLFSGARALQWEGEWAIFMVKLWRKKTRAQCLTTPELPRGSALPFPVP